MQTTPETQKMSVRAALDSDAPQIERLIGDIWAEYGCVLDTDIEEQYLLTPAGYFHARSGEFWVVEDPDRIVATVAVMMNGDGIAELKSLYVHQEHRGSGLGERLTMLAIGLAKQRDARKMVFWTDTRFTAAHRLYERLGFTKTGTRELDDINNTTEFGFVLPLG
jgi:N-acetylglutamate synthase-like GNAT family acetyltransferase